MKAVLKGAVGAAVIFSDVPPNVFDYGPPKPTVILPPAADQTKILAGFTRHGVSTVITYKPGEENQRFVEQVAVNTQLTKPEDSLKIVFGQTTPNKHFFGGTSTVVKIKPGL